MRLARNAAELMTLSADLQAVAGQIERNDIREKTLEGQVIAAAKGNHGAGRRSSTTAHSPSPSH
jgi:hypothetical protein